MAADLNTFIELEGTLEEAKSMIAVIKDYCGHGHDASLDFPRISSKKKFDGKNDVLLETLTEDALEAFLTKCKKKIFIEAGGPYGSYGRVDEAGLFEAIAEAAPTAKFKAHTIGFTTGQRDDFAAELKKGKLHLTYSCLPDDYEINDDADDEMDEDWFTEKNTYDPIEKKYKKQYSEEDYVSSMINKMPLNEFKNLFGLSKSEISNDEYRDYIFECYCSYSFPEMDFDDFKYTFPAAEIDEEEFNMNVTIAIEKFGLVRFETFCK